MRNLKGSAKFDPRHYIFFVFVYISISAFWISSASDQLKCHQNWNKRHWAHLECKYFERRFILLVFNMFEIVKQKESPHKNKSSYNFFSKSAKVSWTIWIFCFEGKNPYLLHFHILNKPGKQFSIESFKHCKMQTLLPRKKDNRKCWKIQ